MALDLLNCWTQDFCRMTGCSARALDGPPGVVLDAGRASLIAIEWQAGTHTLHVYGHPGNAARVGPPQGGAPDSEWDDDEADDGGDAWRGGGCHPVCLDARANDAEGTTLHQDPDTGLVTLYRVVPFSTLDAHSFAAVLEAFIDDMALWSTVFAQGSSAEQGTGGAPGLEAARAMASGLIFA